MNQAQLTAASQADAALRAAGVESSVAGNLINKQRIGYDTALYAAGSVMANAKLFSKNKGVKLPSDLQNLEFPAAIPIQINAICAVPMLKFVAGEVGQSLKEQWYAYLLLSNLEVFRNDTPLYRIPLLHCLPYNVIYDVTGDALTFVHKTNPFTALPDPVIIGIGDDGGVNIIKPDSYNLTMAASAAVNPHLNANVGGVGSGVITTEGRVFYTRVFISYNEARNPQVV